MVQMQTEADPGLLSPGGGSAVKAVTKVKHQHHVPRLLGQEVSEGGCAPEELKNCICWNSIRAIWYIPFGNILLKNLLR